jgi:hypothetical protein
VAAQPAALAAAQAPGWRSAATGRAAGTGRRRQAVQGGQPGPDGRAPGLLRHCRKVASWRAGPARSISTHTTEIRFPGSFFTQPAGGCAKPGDSPGACRALVGRSRDPRSVRHRQLAVTLGPGRETEQTGGAIGPVAIRCRERRRSSPDFRRGFSPARRRIRQSGIRLLRPERLPAGIGTTSPWRVDAGALMRGSSAGAGHARHPGAGTPRAWRTPSAGYLRLAPSNGRSAGGGRVT